MKKTEYISINLNAGVKMRAVNGPKMNDDIGDVGGRVRYTNYKMFKEQCLQSKTSSMKKKDKIVSGHC